MYDNLQMALEGKYTTTLGGACVTVDYRVCQNNEAQVHFIYLGTDYNFSMTRWKQKAFSPFRAKFHEVYKDIDKYGTSDVDPDTGDVISSSCTSVQNKQIVIRAIEDVFHYLNQPITDFSPRDRSSSKAKNNFDASSELCLTPCVAQVHAKHSQFHLSK